MSDILLGAIKQSYAHRLDEIRQNQTDIFIGIIKQSLGFVNEHETDKLTLKTTLSYPEI